MSGDKKWTRRAAVGFIGTGAGLLAVETAGFTQIDGVRDVNLDTEADPDGLVGFSPMGVDGTVAGCPGARVGLFDLTNNLDDHTDSDDEMIVDDVEITGTSGDISEGDIIDFELPDPIIKGETGSVSGKLSSENEGVAGEVEFKIDVSQDDVSTTLDRTILIEIKTEVIKTFTRIGDHTWEVPEDVTGVDVLAVGGGGGGAANTNFNSAGGGGGGAGGLAFAADYEVLPGDTVDITVGDGGDGINTQGTPADNGEDSEFDSLTAIGGGGGNLTSGNNNQSASDGGSGGGGRQNPPGKGIQPGENPDAEDFGNDGAKNSTDNGGSGGGGAGKEPGDTDGDAGGEGGDGLAVVSVDSETYRFADVFGTTYGEEHDDDVYFAGGGGGGGDGNGARGSGGLGGGGDGASDRDNQPAEDGAKNTGGGGGGGASGPDGTPGGDGGSGIVLLKYCTSQFGDSESALSDLDIADQGDKATVVSGNDEDVTVNVTNVGETAARFLVTLEIDDDVEVTKTTAELEPDEDETVTFEGVSESLTTGEYDVSVVTEDDEITGVLDVIEQAGQFDETKTSELSFSIGTGEGGGGGAAKSGVGFQLFRIEDATGSVILTHIGVDVDGTSGNRSAGSVRSGENDEGGEFIEIEDNDDPDLKRTFVDREGKDPNNIPIPSVNDPIPLDDPTVIELEDEPVVVLRRFRRSDNDKALNLNNSSVTVLLRFADGSELQIGPKEF